MSDRQKYDQGALHSAVADIASAASTLHGIHGDVNRDVQTLHTTWQSGKGQVAYQGYQSEWDKIFIEVNQALTTLGKAVDTARENADLTDSGVAKAWSV